MIDEIQIWNDELLKSSSCRKIVSDLFNSYGQSEVICWITKYSYVVVQEDVKLRVIQSPVQVNERLLKILIDKKVLSVVDFFTDSGSAFVRVNIENFEKIKYLAIVYSNFLVEEPYGHEKQCDQLKDILKKKFIKLANDSLKLTMNDLSKQDSDHIEILKTIYLLSDDSYIEIERLNIDLDISFYEDFGFQKLIHGPMSFNATLKLKNKLLVEWANVDKIEVLESVAYSIATGKLSIEGTNYQLCSPGKSTISDVISTLVENINSSVSYEILLMRGWDLTEMSLRKLYEGDGKDKHNKKVKEVIKDIRKKLVDHNLHKRLEITGDSGYKLVYKKTEINKLQLAYALDKNRPVTVDDIPF